MSTKVTVKASSGKYSWSQTPEAVTIMLPLKNVLMKHIEVVYTDLVLKVNARSISYVQIVDFPHEIDFENPTNRTQLTEQGLEIFLNKQVPQTWTELQFSGLKGAELTARRQASLDRYYELQKQKYKETQSKVYELDGVTVKQQMKAESF